MIGSSGELYQLLTTAGPHRSVYRGRGDGWFVTYGGGEVPRAWVDDLLSVGLICSTYSDCPDEMYHVGKTLDVKATLEERKNHRRGKDAPLIYTDGSREPRPRR